ncbi:MAG: 4Fe-4S dicluster domain-containing protein, partial [Bacteroidota bacterium]|nr:4Fe-4S dicluster domain-containing protein [Bacteroidota bacterium]
RYTPGQTTPAFKTVFRYHNQDVLQHAEQCNGSGDCRKTELSGGTMCPSFMATRNEQDTTRARANILREFLTNSDKANRFDHEEIKDVMDLCISCKGCKSECPSNVDMAKLKAEFLQQYYDANGIPFRAKLIANFNNAAKMGALLPGMYNFMMTNSSISKLVKKFSGFALERSMPTMHKVTLRKWFEKHKAEMRDDRWQMADKKRNNFSLPVNRHLSTVNFFCDEFTNYNDTEIGIKAIMLLEKLGYQVVIPKHRESSRAWLSKGLLRKAKKIAQRNVSLLAPLINKDTPLIGIEPSAILTFRDEYIDLVNDDQLQEAKELSLNVYLIDEFITKEMAKGNITKEQFTSEKKLIRLHGHCQQKAWNALSSSVTMLSLPQNYSVETIPSGCCGMAGSFGYEKEHYAISMQIGELVLFPFVRNLGDDVIIAAPGTSCRHQIKDGTGKKAKHPVEILYEALI